MDFIKKNMAKATGNTDEFIKITTDELWEKYDVDRNGYLDKNESKKLVQDYFKNESDKKEEVTETFFEETFKKFDFNQDGKVEKAEMARFLKSLVEKAGVPV